jgi:chemotaxis signal transduction protein
MVQEIPRIEGDRSFLLVRSGAVRYAFHAAEVVRVVRGLVCHPVPASRIYFLGLAQFGGEPLPVVDLHTLVEGRTSGARHQNTVILGRERRRSQPLFGLAVDEVLRVIDINESVDSRRKNGHLIEEVDIDGESVKIFHTDRLLRQGTDVSEAVDG